MQQLPGSVHAKIAPHLPQQVPNAQASDLGGHFTRLSALT